MKDKKRKQTWKNPHSLQARWSLDNSEFPNSMESNLSMSITGISRTRSVSEMTKSSCWWWTYLGGTEDIFSLANSWTEGTRIEVPYGFLNSSMVQGAVLCYSQFFDITSKVAQVFFLRSDHNSLTNTYIYIKETSIWPQLFN